MFNGQNHQILCSALLLPKFNKTYGAKAPYFGRNKMNKLLEAFIKNPTEQTRAKLQAYLNKHMMAICLATPEQKQILNSNGFKV